MHASNSSWFVRRFGAVVGGSVPGRVASWLYGHGRAVVRQGPDVAPRLGPIPLDAVTPSLASGRLGQTLGRVTRTLSAAVSHSRTARAIARVNAAAERVPLERRVAYAAWVLFVAAVVHIVLLLAVEQYHYPRRTALILPGLVAVIAVLVALQRAPVARALASRRR